MNYYNYLCIVVFFCLVNQGCSEPPATFDTYKQLPKEERVKLIKDPTNEMQLKYIEWEQRLKMGEQAWKDHQRKRLLLEKGYYGFINLFSIQENLWSEYFDQCRSLTKGGSNATNQAVSDECKPIFDQLSKIDNEHGKDCFYYIPKLAKTPDASKLDNKATELYKKWSLRFPSGESRVIKQSDLTELDSEVGEIRRQMRKLPQLTPEQEDAAIEALPPEPVTRDWPLRGNLPK